MTEWYEKYVNKDLLDKSLVEKYFVILKNFSLKVEDNIETLENGGLQFDV